MDFLKYISEYIRSGESKDKNLGLEIEHFIIDDEGRQIEFHEISERGKIGGNSDLSNPAEEAEVRKLQ